MIITLPLKKSSIFINLSIQFNVSLTSWGMQLAQFDVAGKMFSIVIATIQIHATGAAFSWKIQTLILKFGFQILQSNTKSENGFHL